MSLMQALEQLQIAFVAFLVMTVADKSVSGKQPEIKQEMERLAKKPRTHEQKNFTNLEELQDLAEPILPRMVEINPMQLMLPNPSIEDLESTQNEALASSMSFSLCRAFH